MTGAASAHVAGTLVDEGKRITLGLELLAGRGGKGRITLEGLSIRLIRVDGSIFINGSDAFYRRLAGPRAAKLLEGKWLKAPAGSGNFAATGLADRPGQADRRRPDRSRDAHSGGEQDGGRAPGGGRGGRIAGGHPRRIHGHAVSAGDRQIGCRRGEDRINRWNQEVTLEAPVGAVNIKELKNSR